MHSRFSFKKGKCRPPQTKISRPFHAEAKIRMLTKQLFMFLLISFCYSFNGNVFIQWAFTLAQYINQSKCWVCGQIPIANTSGLPWWVSPLQGTDGKALQTLTIEQQQ